MSNQTQRSESSRFKLKIITAELEQIKTKGPPQFESLGDFWDPIEKEEEEEEDLTIDFVLLESAIKMVKELTKNDDIEEIAARRHHHGEVMTPIFSPMYNCWIPANCFTKARFNEAWMSYRANLVETEKKGEWSMFNYRRYHITNKSVLVRSQSEFEVEGVTGAYGVADTLSEQDLIDFLSVNFLYLKGRIPGPPRWYNQETVHKLACLFTAVRYVAFIQGYLGNDFPTHWEIVEEVKEKISEEVIKEINLMKSDVHQLIIAITAEWWTADFSVGAIGQFPPLLKKMLLNLKTLRPIFEDLMSSEREMQEIIEGAMEVISRRNVLKAVHLDNNEWTGEIPMGLPVIKKVDIEKLANSEILEMFKRVPAGSSSYGNCHKVLEILKKYKLKKFIFYKDEAKLVESVVQEINGKPN